MLKRILAVMAFAGLFTLNLHAQIEEFEFGDVSVEDLAMTVYPKDSGAVAVYLLDKGYAFMVQSDLSMMLEVHVRIKILKEEGLEYGNVSLPYLRGQSEITKLKAATHNLVDGKVVTTDIKRRDWVDETINDDRRLKKLSFPDVKVGSIIEYSYSRKTGDIVNLPAWVFQTNIPVRYSEYKIDIPSFGIYQPNFQGYHPAAYVNNTSGVNHIVMKDVPALKREPYISTLENYRSKIDYEIKSINIPGYINKTYMTDWNDINKTLYESSQLGDVVYNTGPLRQIYPEEMGWTANKESLVEIFNYVRDHFKWNQRFAYGVVDRSKKLWEAAEGDNADINVTLAQFLTKAGFQVYPVVLSTRGHGYLKQFVPLVKQFNYMVICVDMDGERILLDATDKYRPYNVLPPRALNGEGLMVRKGGLEWVDLRTNNEMDSKTVSGQFRLNEDDVLEGKVEVNFYGLAASRIRKSVYEKKEKQNTTEEKEDEKTEEEDEIKDYEAGEIENAVLENESNPEKELVLKYDFTLEDNVNIIGDKIFLNPFIIKTVKENPFKLENRKFPVELPAPLMDTYLFQFKLPEGFEVEELPESQNLVLPDGGGKFMFISGVQGDEVQVMIRLQLAKTVYLPQEYAGLKELFNLIVMKQEQQIVLKKKAE